jgi:hypothetical protein
MPPNPRRVPLGEGIAGVDTRMKSRISHQSQRFDIDETYASQVVGLNRPGIPGGSIS